MPDWEYDICPQCDGHGGGEWGGRPCGYPGCHRRGGVFQVPVGRSGDSSSAPPPQVIHVQAAPARASLTMQILSRRGGRRAALVAFLGLAWLIWLWSLPLAASIAAVLGISLIAALRSGPEAGARIAAAVVSALTLGVAGIWFSFFGAPDALRRIPGPSGF